MVRAGAIDGNGRKVADIYAAYEKQLQQSGALDFDDLLLRATKLLRESQFVREKWQARFRYIHVDEYQDTNRVQYELLKLLAGPKQNVCVVGDEDQSIYRWRGADVSILLSFSRDFPGRRSSSSSAITARRNRFWTPRARWSVTIPNGWENR